MAAEYFTYLEFDENFKAFEREFCEIVEEVKHFRECSSQHEKKYFVLLEETSFLREKLEQEHNHRLQLQAYERSLHAAKKTMEDEKVNSASLLRKKDLQIELVEEERESLKNEIKEKAVFLYEMERKKVSLEQETNVEKKARLAAEKYASQMEQELLKSEKSVELLREDVARLANAVKETIEVARSVDNSFIHSDCLLDDARAETEKSRKELVVAEAKVAQHTAQVHRFLTEDEPSGSIVDWTKNSTAESAVSNKTPRHRETGLLASNTKSSELLINLQKELEAERELRVEVVNEAEHQRILVVSLTADLQKRQFELAQHKQFADEHMKTCRANAELLASEVKEQTKEIDRLKDSLRMLNLEHENCVVTIGHLNVDLASKEESESECQNRIMELEAEVERLSAQKPETRISKCPPAVEEGTETPHSTTDCDSHL